MFYRVGLEAWIPEPTHNKSGDNGLPKWRPCREKIDLTDEGQSIFARKENLKVNKAVRRKLAPPTMARIAYGMKKFSLKGLFLTLNYSANGKPVSVASIDLPSPTISTKDRICKVSLNKTAFITQNIQQSLSAQDIDRPLGTILTRDEKVVATIRFVACRLGSPQFILKKHEGKHNVQSIDGPLHTILSNNDGKQKVAPQFILKQHSGEANSQSADMPLASIMTVDRKALLTINGQEIDTNSLHYQERREFFEEYFEEYDTEILLAIILDVKMRYLNSVELADITGFKPGTNLGKTETSRKKHIGNAVPPVLSRALVEAQWSGNALSI